MPKNQLDKRQRLIDSAVKLAYRNGFRETSLADIAASARVPVGNVYYYFKTKDEIGEAVIEWRLDEFRALRVQLEQIGSPRERLLAFVGGIQAGKEELAHGGCPLGGLCTELRRQGGALAKKAVALYSEPMSWFEEQFRAAGHGQKSRELAVHLFCVFEGIAAVAHGANDPDIAVMESRRLRDWLNTL